jgi:UDP-N-acetylglucosamine--N-acetylmuramyl-(pentapeptide) pyrophosphoryl-undecaprenol N-acetylglucosamine transferase
MIAAGGTGGHVYPALAAAEALLALRPNAELSFVGSAGGFERPLIQDAGLNFHHYDEVRAGPLHGVRPWTAAVSVGQITAGTAQAVALVRRRRPDALLLTGGWVGLPAALAARAFRVPALIYLPDIEPGLAIRRLTPLVRRVAITVPDAATYFPAGKTVVTGYPIRAVVRAATREAGLAHFRLDPARPTLLVFGGSRGARSLNQAVLAAAPEIVAAGAQIIHVTGTLDWNADSARRAALAADDAAVDAHYHLFPYLHAEMGLAMAAADLALCRSGASTLGELPWFGLPAILVPYPYAWRYQKTNADWLAQRGAGVVLRDEDMAHALLPLLRDVLGDPARLAAMRAHAQALAQPEGAKSADGAYNLARELLRLAGDKA